MAALKSPEQSNTILRGLSLQGHSFQQLWDIVTTRPNDRGLPKTVNMIPAATNVSVCLQWPDLFTNNPLVMSQIVACLQRHCSSCDSLPTTAAQHQFTSLTLRAQSDNITELLDQLLQAELEKTQKQPRVSALVPCCTNCQPIVVCNAVQNVSQDPGVRVGVQPPTATARGIPAELYLHPTHAPDRKHGVSQSTCA